MVKKIEAVNLLWTGGWDSTYRLCELILVKKRVVNPIYIIDPSRKSVAEEVKAMMVIRKGIMEKGVDYKPLLKPVQVVIKDDIPQNKAITEQYEAIVKNYGRLGRQYEWLARYASWTDLCEIEIGVEGASSFPRRPVYAQLEKELVSQGDSLIIGDILDDNLFSFFKRFSFPIFDKPKFRLLQLAKAQGFYDLMLKTWFCHNPRKGKACGTCRPCEQVMCENMGFRMPLSGKIRYALKNNFRI